MLFAGMCFCLLRDYWIGLDSRQIRAGMTELYDVHRSDEIAEMTELQQSQTKTLTHSLHLGTMIKALFLCMMRQQSLMNYRRIPQQPCHNNIRIHRGEFRHNVSTEAGKQVLIAL